jgi:hypothetical protein
MLRALRQGLRRIARQRGLPPEDAEAFLDRAGRPLALLTEAHGLARAVLEARPGAAVAFRRHVEATVARTALAGSTRLLFDRTGVHFPDHGPLARAAAMGDGGSGSRAMAMARRAPSFTPEPEPGRFPCGIIGPAGMAEIYMAAWEVFVLSGHEVDPPRERDLVDVLDTLVGLSMAHGHLEVLYEGLMEGGIDGLEQAVNGEATPAAGFGPGGMPEPGGRPGGDIPEPGGRPVGGFPEPGGRPGGGLPDRGGGSGREFPEPGDFGPPAPEGCELIREMCEALLLEALNEGLPAMPLPPRPAIWADTIDRIELSGPCAGDLMTIHGHGFGASQPDHVHVVMTVGGTCAAVAPRMWSDTRIEVVLPDGINSGSVGFYNEALTAAEVERYNSDVSRYNRAVKQVMASSKCAGMPLDLPVFPHRGPMAVICAPRTAVNVITAGLPIIQSFTVSTEHNTGTEVVADPEDELVLRWDVATYDWIELERTSSGGPRFDGERRVRDPMGTSWSLGPAGHTGPEVFVYVLRAGNVCGTVSRTVEVIGAKRPRLSILRVEVTQGVQTEDQDVPLVSDKASVVRVYATHGLDGFGGLERVAGVTGRIRKIAPTYSDWLSPVNGVSASPPDPPAPDPAAAIDVPVEPDPTVTNDTLNFVLPAALCRLTVDLEVELLVFNVGAPPGRPGFNERISVVFEGFDFDPRRRLKMRFLPVEVEPDPEGNVSITIVASNPPTNGECRDFLTEAFKLLPAVPESIERLAGMSAWVNMERFEASLNTPWGSFSIPYEDFPMTTESMTYDIGANLLTYTLGFIRTCELLDFTGVVCVEDHDAYWAVVMPVSGVWGRANGTPGREFISGMNPLAAAHEMGHCLNQHHIVGTDCGGGSTAYGGGDPTEDPENWPDGGEIVPSVAVPFDIVQNRTIVDDEDGVWDLMAYCVTRWTSPQRWQMIFDYIGE